MSYKPHTSNVPSGVLYYGDPAGEAMLKASSTFAYDDGNDRLAVGKLTTTSDVIVGGNLTVNGTSTIVNSNTVDIGDSVILLNSDAVGSATQDAGLEVERGSDANVFLIYDEGNNRWEFTNNGADYFPIPTQISDLSGGGYIASITAGAGLSDSGTSTNPNLYINVDNSTIEIDSDILRIKDLGVTSGKLAAESVTEVKRSRTVDTSFSDDDIISSDINLVTTGSSSIELHLPTAVTGKRVTIKKIDSGSGSVTIKGNEHNSVIDLIDGAGSKILYYQYESLTCVAVDDGTASNVQNWYII